MYGLVPAMDVAFRSSFTMAAMLKSVRWTWPAEKAEIALLQNDTAQILIHIYTQRLQSSVYGISTNCVSLLKFKLFLLELNLPTAYR